MLPRAGALGEGGAPTHQRQIDEARADQNEVGWCQQADRRVWQLGADQHAGGDGDTPAQQDLACTLHLGVGAGAL
jgi:hypothetical protein